MIRQITNERVTSLENLDKQLANRQAAIKTIPVEAVPDGLQQENTIEINQTPNYKSNVEPRVG